MTEEQEKRVVDLLHAVFDFLGHCVRRDRTDHLAFGLMNDTDELMTELEPPDYHERDKEE